MTHDSDGPRGHDAGTASLEGIWDPIWEPGSAVGRPGHRMCGGGESRVD